MTQFLEKDRMENFHKMCQKQLNLQILNTERDSCIHQCVLYFHQIYKARKESFTSKEKKNSFL